MSYTAMLYKLTTQQTAFKVFKTKIFCLLANYNGSVVVVNAAVVGLDLGQKIITFNISI
jgi:hypothetical protein